MAAAFPSLAAATCFTPETPRFLLWRDDKTRCVEALQWLRGHYADIGTEFTRLADTLATNSGEWGGWAAGATKALLAPVALSGLIMILAAMSGLQQIQILMVTRSVKHKHSCTH